MSKLQIGDKVKYVGHGPACHDENGRNTCGGPMSASPHFMDRIYEVTGIIEGINSIWMQGENAAEKRENVYATHVMLLKDEIFTEEDLLKAAPYNSSILDKP